MINGENAHIYIPKHTEWGFLGTKVGRCSVLDEPNDVSITISN